MMIKQNMTPFIQTQKQVLNQVLKQVSKTSIKESLVLIIYLNQSILQLYQPYKNFESR